MDTLRYFLLHHYGGIYIDLDIFTYRPLTPLLTFPALACRTTPTGVSNDVLFSTPHHPFFSLVIERLETYNRDLFFPYLTVMYTTGPLFFSAIWIEYLSGETRGAVDRLRVLVKGSLKGDSYGFWKNVPGGSWHEADSYFILWMGDHLMLMIFLGLMTGLTVGVVLWAMLRRSVAPPGSKEWWEQEKERERLMWKLSQLR